MRVMLPGARTRASRGASIQSTDYRSHLVCILDLWVTNVQASRLRFLSYWSIWPLSRHSGSVEILCLSMFCASETCTRETRARATRVREIESRTLGLALNLPSFLFGSPCLRRTALGRTTNRRIAISSKDEKVQVSTFVHFNNQRESDLWGRPTDEE